MRNLKGLLAAALVFAMVIAFVPAAAALDFTDSGDIENVGAVELLVSLGIIKGHDDGSFDPQGNLTRGEAAKIIYVATRGEDDGAGIFAGSSLFTDVPKGLWSQGYINYAAVMELVAGHGDGTFDPEGDVTGYEFLKILLCALGYDQEQEKFVDNPNWEYSVLTAALKKGLTAGFEGDLSAALKRDDAALMAANMIYAATVRYDANARPQSTGVTFGEANLGLTTISGILVANTEVALDGQTITDEGSIIMVGDSTVLVPLASDRAQLGSAVSAMVSVKQGSSLVAEDGSYNSAAIARGFGEVKTNDELTVELDIAKNKIAEDAEYYINYKKATAGEFAALGAGHRVRAISNDGDNIIDMVIAEKMSFGEVTNVSSAGVVTVAGSRYDGDSAVGVDGLQKGDKVLYLTIEGGKTCFERPETVTGTATGYTSKYVLIDGERFEAATGVAGFETSDAPLGSEATYYLLDGRIVACSEEQTETGASYALALRATKIGWEWRAEMIDMSGVTATCVIANPEDVIADGDLPFGLYDMKEQEDGSVKLTVVDITGRTGSESFSYTQNTPRLGDKFVTSRSVFFLEIDGEWKVYSGMANIPSFTAEAGERQMYGVTKDLYGTDDMIAAAVIPNVKLSDEQTENHFVVLGDVINIAGGKVSFEAWDGGSVKSYTSAEEGIATGGVYKFTLNAGGDVVTAFEAVEGRSGVVTDAADFAIRIATAGTEDAEILTYTKDTKVIIVDLTKNTAEFGEMEDLSMTASDAAAEMDEGENDTLIVIGDSGVATHIYQFITE